MKLFTITASLSLLLSSSTIVLNEYDSNNFEIVNKEGQTKSVSPYDISSYHLDISEIRQETPYFCVPAAFQMVLGYFGADLNIPELSQQQIYADLNGQGGVLINQGTVNHLNNLIRLFGVHTPATYELVTLNPAFGYNESDLTMFELYVTYSLFRNVPVLLTQTSTISGDMNHELVISGIDIDPNSAYNTVYSLIDPYGTPFSIRGSNLYQYFQTGGYLMGLQSAFDFSQQIITTVNDAPQNVSFNTLGNHQVNVRNNLTYSAGITNVRQLNNFRNIDWGTFSTFYSFNNQAVSLVDAPLDGGVIEENDTTPFYTLDFRLFTDHVVENRTYSTSLNLSTSNSTTNDGFLFDFDYQLINSILGNQNNVNTLVELKIDNKLILAMKN